MTMEVDDRMHTFPSYAADDPRLAAALVREHPFTLLVSGGEVPVATHTPVIPEPGGGAVTSFVGTTLLGHVARANPHWRLFEEHPRVLVVFSGPHGYVSPTTYDADPTAPTWNYAAVHLTGTVEPITDDTGALRVVEETVRAMESRRSPAWDMAPSRELFHRIIGGVAAFRIHVETQQSTFKLSQDLEAPIRHRVRDEFADGDHPNPPLADLMTRADPRYDAPPDH
ncbi:FMN-binding negative transcriptional regulator [Nocardiopsis mangrovi]|uniref:FMN-binding negative transcriptional regulator n=1 Tax=Nocardiopsis mangrovi TaxID=1179818 RepID=A0ABV9E1T1_9ACTN